MSTFKIELDQTTYEKLLAVAIREWRPTQWQAEMLLRKAILQESSRQQHDPLTRTADSLEHEASHV